MHLTSSLYFLLTCFTGYGFNPGSALVISNSGMASVASLCAVTTTLGAASGCISAMFTDSILEAIRTGETSYDLTMAMNGALAGLVAVTAGCSTVEPWAAIIIGVVGGWFYIGCSKLLVALRIDDAVDAVPVHLANGFWGILAVGLFAKPELMELAGYNHNNPGWFYSHSVGGNDMNLLMCQIIAILWIVGWVTCTMTPFLLF